MDVLNAAIRDGQLALAEDQAEKFLAGAGIPVCRGNCVHDAGGAVEAAREMGFPIALKAIGRDLLHKTEAGAVALDLTSEQAVREAAQRLLAVPGCERLLVQEMVRGVREFVCGVLRDRQLGPCVMFGLGGILAEALDDAIFRIAPLTLGDAADMLAELRSRRLLDPSRGEMAADREALCRILVAVGQIALQHDAIQAIDINPLKIRADGSPVAVDALVSLQRDGDNAGVPDRALWAETRRRVALKTFFEARSVAIVGASAVPGKAGYEAIRNLLANEYSGQIYPVNPKGGEILGLRVYPSVADLPKGVDLGVVILPAEATTAALRGLALRGVRHAVLVAGGFAEVDDAGARIQDELTKIIQDTGIRVLGPNTSGHISTPHAFTSAFFPLGKIRRGHVSVIAQTGNFATHTMKSILTGEQYGVCRVVGLGNKIDVDESEALEYLGDDPETAAVVMYLESFKRPRRFLEVARAVTRQKPVIMLKSGATEAGQHAAVAHTAAMASEDRLVEGLVRQAGIVRVADYTQLLLAAKALSFLPLPHGNRVSFLAPSGAMLVTMADLCMRLGLELPVLSVQTQARLQNISPAYIRMRNPVDIWASAVTRGSEFAYREGMEAVLRDPGVDGVVAILMVSHENGMPPVDFVVDLVKRYPNKPVLISFSGDAACMVECKADLERQGVPTFPEIEQPFEALAVLARCAQARRRPV